MALPNKTSSAAAARKMRNLKTLSPAERKAYLNLYLQQNRGRKPYGFGRRAGAATGRVLRPLSKKHGAGALTELARNWPDIVGANYAKLSRPSRIIGGKDANCLHIIARGPAATLLSANRANILAKVNQFTGQTSGQKAETKPISKLKITQGEINLGSQSGRQSGRQPVHLANRSKNARHPAASPATSLAPRQARRGLTPSEESQLRLGLDKLPDNPLKQALEKLGRGVISRQKP